MDEREQQTHGAWKSLVLGTALSLLLHAGAAWALNLLSLSPLPPSRSPAPKPARHVTLLRVKPHEQAATQTANKPQEPPEATFAKTSADEAERRPKQADFVGKRDSAASGGPDAPQRSSEAPLPTMAGRESDEVVTFDQERQDGDLAHEGKAIITPLPPSIPPPPQEPPPEPQQPPALGRAEGNAQQGTPQGEGARPPLPTQEVSTALLPEPSASGEGQKLGNHLPEDALTSATELPPPARLGQPEGEPVPHHTPATPLQPRRPHAVVYDPSLAASAQQPGLRTHERRTRSTGRFVFGRRPALNVAATARGRYEAEIYRRIARIWYAACDEHRGDIIPGSITVSLRLTQSGRIDSMDLVRRRGASVIQQSFSFGAIRRAALPPMPAEVQSSLIGRLYEMILTFNFD